MNVNAWCFVIFIGVIIALAMAKRQYRIRSNRTEVWLERCFTAEYYLLLASAITLIVALLLLVESTAGIVQFIDDRLVAGEEEMLTGFLFSVFWLSFSILAGAAVFAVGVVAGWLYKIRAIVLVAKCPVLDKDRGKEPKPRPVKRPASKRSPTKRPSKNYRASANYGMR